MTNWKYFFLKFKLKLMCSQLWFVNDCCLCFFLQVNVTNSLKWLFLLSDYFTVKEVYYPNIDVNDHYNNLNLYQRRLIKNRNRESGPVNKKLAVRLVCSCGRNFSYLAGYRYHMRWECGKILKCAKCFKVYTDKSNLVKHLNICGNLPKRW